MTVQEYELTKINISDLHFDETNPNQLTKEQEQALKKAMKRFGYLVPIVINENYEIGDGEHRAKLYKEMGLTEIPAYIVPKINDDIERRLLRQTMNKLRGEHEIKMDADEIALIFQNNKLNDLTELLATQRDELENILTKHKGIQFQHEDNFDVDKELEDLVPVTELGDIWQLGNHRIICADCSDERSIKKLMEDPELKVDLLILDPPYNIGIAEWDSISEYFNTLKTWIQIHKNLVNKRGSIYLFHNDMSIIAKLIIWLEDNTDLVFHQFIVWNKKILGGLREDYLERCNEFKALRNYQKMAEYILFYTFQDETGLSRVMLDINNFQSLRKYFKNMLNAMGFTTLKQVTNILGRRAEHCFYWDTTQWDIPTEKTYNDLIPLIKDPSFEIKPYHLLRQEYESLRQEYESLRQEYESLRYTFNNLSTHSSVWDYELEENRLKDDHPTPKPLALITTILKYSSNENDLIFDPFLGSGSTLIACEQTNRICYGCEIDPRYIDIIVKRFQGLTGKDAVRLKDNKTYNELKEGN